MKYVLVAVLYFVYDVIWARYTVCVSEHRPFAAATYALAIYGVGAFGLLAIVGDRKCIIPAAIGGFAGTYFAVWRSKCRTRIATSP